MMGAAQHFAGENWIMTAFLMLAYGFVATFVMGSLSRNRREERPDTPILTYAGHGLMAVSVTGACLALCVAGLTAFGLSFTAFGVSLG
ncbi:hypothetical protein CMV14_04140 [Rhizorhabdus dicambivorans]|nr:hypothetical protein CMV14_04140 [Rhizorhabdus dicambivorans]